MTDGPLKPMQDTSGGIQVPSDSKNSNGLKEPELHELEEMSELIIRQRAPLVGARDLPAWQDVLMDSVRTPLTRMRVENQTENGCQGHATKNGEQARSWYASGCRVMPDLSERYAYQASEYRMRPQQVGRDEGTSIHSGVRVLTEGIPALGIPPGLPSEQAWPSSVWCRSQREFESRVKSGLKINESCVAQVREPPESFTDMLALVAAGATLHQGTYWGPRWSDQKPENKRRVIQFPRSGGGHATEGIWGRLVSGEWLLAVWNSHGDAWYWVDQAEYTRLQRIEWAPFGAYVLQPVNVVEKYDAIKQGGGYF